MHFRKFQEGGQGEPNQPTDYYYLAKQREKFQGKRSIPKSISLFQVLFAFMVGLHNLYWYYGAQKVTVHTEDDASVLKVPASEAFEG